MKDGQLVWSYLCSRIEIGCCAHQHSLVMAHSFWNDWICTTWKLRHFQLFVCQKKNKSQEVTTTLSFLLECSTTRLSSVKATTLFAGLFCRTACSALPCPPTLVTPSVPLTVSRDSEFEIENLSVESSSKSPFSFPAPSRMSLSNQVSVAAVNNVVHGHSKQGGESRTEKFHFQPAAFRRAKGFAQSR